MATLSRSGAKLTAGGAKGSKLFDNVSVGEPERSVFDLSHECKTTINCGRLYPILVQDLQTNEDILLDTSIFARSMPMTCPFMGNYIFKVHTFFVPARILDHNFYAKQTKKDFYGDDSIIAEQNKTAKFPYFTLSYLVNFEGAFARYELKNRDNATAFSHMKWCFSQFVGSHSLLARLGYKFYEELTPQTGSEFTDTSFISTALNCTTYPLCTLTIGTEDTKLIYNTGLEFIIGNRADIDDPINAFPLLAYNAIWDDYYRNPLYMASTGVYYSADFYTKRSFKLANTLGTALIDGTPDGSIYMPSSTLYKGHRLACNDILVNGTNLYENRTCAFAPQPFTDSSLDSYVFNAYGHDLAWSSWLRVFALKPVTFDRDYFTSAVPTASYGGDSEQPYVTSSGSTTFEIDGTSGSLQVDSEGNVSWYGTSPETSQIVSASSNVSFAFKTLRTAAALQKIAEKRNCTTQRYYEYLTEMFGDAPNATKFEHPLYLGGTSFQLQTDVITQTSETGDTPQGNPTGVGVGKGSTGFIKFHAQDYGFIIQLVSCVPQFDYTFAIERWVHTTDADQMRYPDLARLGFQPIYATELDSHNGAVNHSWSHITSTDSTFGYQPIYSWAKVKYSHTSGDFLTKSSLSSWCITRYNELLGQMCSFGADHVHLGYHNLHNTWHSQCCFYKTYPPYNALGVYSSSESWSTSFNVLITVNNYQNYGENFCRCPWCNATMLLSDENYAPFVSQSDYDDHFYLGVWQDLRVIRALPKFSTPSYI